MKHDVEDIRKVIFFLLHCKRNSSNEMWGAITVSEAYDSACRLFGIDPAKLEQWQQDEFDQS